MSDGEFDDSLYEAHKTEEYVNEDDNSEECFKSYKQSHTEIKPAKKLTHFLPFKIPHTGPCNVSVYFDSLIESRKGTNPNSEEYTTSFRGKIFNGKKIKAADHNFNMIKINQTNQKGFLKTNRLQEINEYFIWKFDEEIPYDNNLLNMQNILNSLDILK